MSTHRLILLKYAPGPHSLKIPPNLPISKEPFGPASVINSREGSTTTQWQGKWDSISRWLQQDPLGERTVCMHEHPQCQFREGRPFPDDQGCSCWQAQSGLRAHWPPGVPTVFWMMKGWRELSRQGTGAVGALWSRWGLETEQMAAQWVTSEP